MTAIMNVQLRDSLAWQMIVPIPLTVIAAIAAIWLLVPRMIQGNAIDQAVLAARNTAAQFTTIREYYTDNVVDRIVTDGTFKVTTDYKGDAKAIPLPATMIHDLSALLTKQDTVINLYSTFPFPNRANRQLDAFQQEAWDFLVKNPKESYSRNEVQNGKRIVRVAVADIMAVQACVNCHNTTAASPKTDWKVGDVRGVLEIASVVDTQLANGAALSRFIIIGAILIGLVLLGITLIVARSVTGPIGDLIAAMQKFANGSFETLPSLGRRDEIGQLAIAFNNMVSEIATAREREVVNQARTATMQAELARVAHVTTMGQMAASIAHEVNQPLAAIVTNSNAGLRWLAHATPNLDEARIALNRIVNDGHRASDIIGSLRAIFRKGDAEQTPLDVNELIREVLSLTHNELQNKQVSVRTDLANELPNVLGNRVQLHLVFRNLIINAIEAMSSITDRGRVLHIKSEISKPSGVLIAVADSGTGIDPEGIGRIFDSFFTTKPHGMGMGLSICRSIVQTYGGRLSVSSSSPHGSIFELVLPAAQLGES